MKTKKLLIGMMFSLMVISCNKDDDNTPVVPVSQQEVAANAQMDDVCDDVLQIVESQSDSEPANRLTGSAQNFMSNCGNVTTTQSGNTWIRTIDFGTTNCTLFNGSTVRGKIILTFTNDFAATTRTISYAFDNFYHND